MRSIADVLADAQAVIDKEPAKARRIILEAGALDRANEHFIAVRQIYARSIYKDEDLLAPQKYEDALAVLETDCALDNSTDGETLGLAGAIYKRLWDHTGQRSHLEKSLKWYAKGYEAGRDPDGWLGVNTAFVSDHLGVQENRVGGNDAAARRTARFATADRIRKEVLAKLNAAGPPLTGAWYHHASRAEAAFGLADFAGAAAALAEGNAAVQGLPREPLRHETTARQLAAVARLRFEGTPDYSIASNVIQNAFGINDDAVSALFGGKIGLAFSGGGFRASLFHIGVLAKMAELDLLRHVEVISCVSGGSVIGAFYYLELKNILESGKTSHADYLQLVRDVETKFLAGVQKNVRTRIALSPLGGLKMALKSGYSRSDVIAELYQKHFYDQTAAKGKEPARFMSDLTVQPAEFPGGKGETFNPKYDNWRLSAKVPMLVLNATTMNTGHNWQFTATWMGESPQAISDTIDAIPRYRRMYYSEAPKPHDQIPIGRAVGASACVPALFEPIVLRNLYPDRTVRLVDGGVHDNQGLSSLLEQNCRVILISDASGQFQEQRSPGGSVSDSLGNSNSVLQARVRESQFDQLTALRRAGAIQGAMFIHLTKDLDADPVSWVGGPEKPAIKATKVTSYGIDRHIQLKLAQVRTDLDSFSEAEAYALMTSGYRMTEHALLEEKCVPSLDAVRRRQSWKFLAAEQALTRKDVENAERMQTLLRVSNELAGKVWRQSLPLTVLGIVLFLAAIAGAGYGLWKYRAAALPSLGIVSLVGIVLIVVSLILAYMDKHRHYHKRLDEMGLGFAIAILGWFAAGLHLLIFDRLFLMHGKWNPAPKQSAVVTSGPRLPVATNPPHGNTSGANVPPIPPPTDPPRDTVN
ncbi:MAG TPA: patatin-like phospholipase family protein [Thermoanaerobaculia bacterium]|jgi:predicted acylesterase/phospholipase RssA|nr:patatin-like phospholipase family protein [Thermoanaerobaculia bacterium]